MSTLLLQIKRVALLASLAFFLLFFGGNPALAVPSYPSTDPPTTDLIPVTTTIHMSSLTEVNSVQEYFEFAGYLQYSWADESVEDGKVKLDDIWHPSIEFVNAIEYTPVSTVATAKDGIVTAQERFKAKNSVGFHFEKFPHDDQNLEVAIESLSEPKVYFVPRGFTYGTDKFVELGEWSILGTSQEAGQNFFSPEGVQYSRLTYSLNVRRNPTYYYSKIMLPIACITMGAIMSLFIPVKEFSTAISAVLTLVLTGLTLWLLSSDALPKTHDVSCLDRLVTASVFYQAWTGIMIMGFFQRGTVKRSLFNPRFRSVGRVVMMVSYPLVAWFAAFH